MVMIAYSADDSKFGVIRVAAQNLIWIIARSSDLRYNGVRCCISGAGSGGRDAVPPLSGYNRLLRSLSSALDP
jgi:hypothetical protein